MEPGGEEESVFADGTVQRLLVDGSRVIHYPNGQRETHTKEFKVGEEREGLGLSVCVCRGGSIWMEQ